MVGLLNDDERLAPQLASDLREITAEVRSRGPKVLRLWRATDAEVFGRRSPPRRKEGSDGDSGHHAPNKLGDEEPCADLLHPSDGRERRYLDVMPESTRHG